MPIWPWKEFGWIEPWPRPLRGIKPGTIEGWSGIGTENGI